MSDGKGSPAFWQLYKRHGILAIFICGKKGETRETNRTSAVYTRHERFNLRNSPLSMDIECHATDSHAERGKGRPVVPPNIS